MFKQHKCGSIVHAHWQIITTPFVPSSVDVGYSVPAICQFAMMSRQLSSFKPSVKSGCSQTRDWGTCASTRKFTTSSASPTCHFSLARNLLLNSIVEGATDKSCKTPQALRSLRWLPSAGFGTNRRTSTGKFDCFHVQQDCDGHLKWEGFFKNP